MSDYTLPRVEEIAALGEGVWQLRWFGAVQRNELVPTEPQIQVLFRSAETEPRSGSDVPHPTRVARIGVGQFPFLTIGSQWKDGHRIESGSPDEVDLEKNIDVSEAESIRTDSTENGHYVLPVRAYPIKHSAFLGAWCVAIPSDSDPYSILIPAAEVVRFYYACSTILARAVFNGSFLSAEKLGSLIAPQSFFDAAARVAGTRLRMRVFNSDAPVIARVLMSAQARLGVRMVYQAVQRESINRGTTHINTCFPFDGVTRLRCRALRFGSANARHRRHLVLEIKQCGGPFPFDRLLRSRDNPGLQADPQTDVADHEKMPAWRRKPIEADVEKFLQSKREPAKGMGAFRLNVGADRYSTLNQIQIEDSEPAFNRYKSIGAKPLTAPTDGSLGTGDGTWGDTITLPSRVAPELRAARRESLGPSFALMASIVDELNALEDIYAHVRQPTDMTASVPVDPLKGYRQWAYLDPVNQRARAVMCAEVKVAQRWFLVIDVERRPKNDAKCLHVVTDQSGESLTEDQLHELLVILSASRWIASNATAPGSIAWRSLKHSSDSAKAYAQRILHAAQHLAELHAQEGRSSASSYTRKKSQTE